MESIIRRWRLLSFNAQLPILMLIIMSIQHVAIEGYTVSFIKVGLLLVASCYFLLHATINVAVITCVIYWLSCYLVSIFHDGMRISTLLYLGLFLVAYLAFYQCVHQGVFRLDNFKRLLRALILAFFITLLIQQLFVIIGIKNVPLINLGISHELGYKLYYEWNRLPTLTCEPSHSAVILTGFMLGWIRCLEMENGGEKIMPAEMFNKENRIVTLAYLYLICFMGSGTGWIGLGIIALYFVRLRTILYVIPLAILFVAILTYTGSKQFNRAKNAVTATLTMDQSKIRETDGSAAIRIVPLVNSLKADLNEKSTWFGNGTIQEMTDEDQWVKVFKRKITTIEQYGLLAFIASLALVFCCVIKRFFCLETLCFVVLLTCDVGNVYYVWSMFYVFTVVRYLQENREEEDETECIDSDSEL